jgi:hypothetical protein
VVVLSSGWTVRAAIWSNDITGASSNGNPYTTGDVKDANITVSGIGAGGGVAANSGGGRYNWRNWTSNTGYFSWTLTPNSGYEIDFASLTGEWQRSGTGPNAYSLRSSLDGFASNIASGSITGSAEPVEFSLNLSAGTFDAIADPITFRLFATGAGGSSGTFSINNFSFHGSVLEAISILLGDMNNDGLVDLDDVNPFVQGLTDPAGYESQFGFAPSTRGDINQSGLFDLDDVNEFVGLLTGDAEQSFTAVPEPGSMGLFMLCSAGLLTIGWRRMRGF